jgi:hypothetical protein
MIVWHRRDLRLADNELYAGSLQTLLPIFIFNPQDFLPHKSVASSFAVARTGPFAAKFLLESVEMLRSQLRALGSDLLVRMGDPQEVIRALVAQLRSHGMNEPIEVAWHDEPGTEEKECADSVANTLHTSFESVQCKRLWGCTLWHPDDLPRRAEEWNLLAHPKQKQKKTRQRERKGAKNSGCMADQKNPDEEHEANVTPRPGDVPLAAVDVSSVRWDGIPGVMGDFRRAARTGASIRPLLPAPSAQTLPPMPVCLGVKLPPGDIPTLAQLMALQTCQAAPVSSPPAPAPACMFGLSRSFIASIAAAAEPASPPPPTAIYNAHQLRGGEGEGFKRLAEFVGLRVGDISNNGAAVSENEPSSHPPSVPSPMPPSPTSVPACSARPPIIEANRSGGGAAGGGLNSSAKLSAYLAFGCLTPRQVVAAVRLAELRAKAKSSVEVGAEAGAKEGTGVMEKVGNKERCGGGGAAAVGEYGWLASHMEMRDFFMFSALQQGKRLFARDTLKAKARKRRPDRRHGRHVQTTGGDASPVERWRRCDNGAAGEWRRWATGQRSLH